MASAQAGPSSPRSSASLDLPSLHPLSHDHPLLAAPTFSADAFLLSRLHIPLEELRGELRSYLAVLREELVQLINDDYEEFISLGTGLRGENDRLRRLKVPLSGLSDEVGEVRDVLLRHQLDVQGKLEQRAALREERVGSGQGCTDGSLCWICWRGYSKRSLGRKSSWRGVRWIGRKWSRGSQRSILRWCICSGKRGPRHAVWSRRSVGGSTAYGRDSASNCQSSCSMLWTTTEICGRCCGPTSLSRGGRRRRRLCGSTSRASAKR